MNPPVDGGGRRSVAEMRELELTIFGQLRDSLALTNTNLTRLAEKVDDTHAHVIQLAAAKYDEQIRDCEQRMQKQLDVMQGQISANRNRLDAQALQLARYGMIMAIVSSIGAAAFSALAVIVIQKLFGAH